MDFFGIGPLELLLILLVTLIVVGPRRLPEMAAQFARYVRMLRRYANSVTSEFNETMKELEREYDDMKGEWKEVGQGLAESTRAVGEELEETTRTVDEELKAADQDARRALEESGRAADSDLESPDGAKRQDIEKAGASAVDREPSEPAPPPG